MGRQEITVDLKKKIAVRRGKSIKLSPKECDLLSYLLENRNRIVDRKKLLKIIWKYAPDVESRVIDVYVGYLRKKIDSDFSKKLIHSVRGVGYVFKE
jgi:DNA-binding response OmpR family regulator